MNIAESNKLIAEFMGFKKTFVRNIKGIPYHYDLPDNFQLIKEVETTIESVWCEILEEQDRCMIEDLKFHSDWNWLMEVVEKINSVGKSGGIKYALFDALGNARLDNAYTEVVNYIIWYNQNQ